MSEATLQRETIGEAPFSVSARVAMQLGRESISNSIVAILELVKNAYDADAENVYLYFVDLDGDQPRLVIDDDGRGMAEDQVTNNWLVIGTDFKLQTRRSLGKKRVYAGEKGLGRLGLDRLCAHTSVQTFTEDHETGVELFIDWRKYEGTTDRLEAIYHPLYRIPSKILENPLTGEPFEKTHGTRLVLSGLRDAWSEETLKRLRGELSLLVSPFAGLNDFAISLAGRDRLERIGSAEILEASEWRLESEIDEQGYIRHHMTGRDGAERKFSGHWSDVVRDTGYDLPRCGPVEFVMYFMTRDEVEGVSFSRAEIKDFLDANQGIRIYRDNFRVKPYGEPTGEGDWLRLSYRRVQNPESRGQSSWKVGYNQVVGAVFIERDRNTALIDQTNREGIVEGAAFADLNRFAEHAVSWFEGQASTVYRARKRMKRFEEAKRHAEASEQEARAATQELEEVVGNALNILDQQMISDKTPGVIAARNELSQAVETIKHRFEQTISAREEVTRAHEEAERSAEREKDTLQNLASLGILAVSFAHETLRHSNLLAGNAEFLKDNLPRWISNVPAELRVEVEHDIGDMVRAADRVNIFAQFLLQNVRRDKRNRVSVYLDRVIQEVLEPFALTETRGIQLERELLSNAPILGFVIDWESILINLMTNAIWALRSITDRERKIRVRLRRENGFLRLSFADSGQGIEKGTIDHIFEPTFTTRRNERGDRIGTGMGLAIVDNLVRSYGAKISVESPCDLGGAEFHIDNIPVTLRASRGPRK